MPKIKRSILDPEPLPVLPPIPDDPTLSPFRRHLERWKDGCGSDQCGRATKLCFARGTVPADILFVGEGPGESEDKLGRPFCGPAGRLLDHIIDRAFADLEPKPTYCLTNLVCCIPRDPDGGKATEPSDEQVLACGPRLIELVEICNPRLLVCVGRLADEWTDPGYKKRIKLPDIRRIAITHPAAILRANVAVQGLMVQRCVIQLRDAVQEYEVKIPSSGSRGSRGPRIEK
jgi:DNA polymerase